MPTLNWLHLSDWHQRGPVFERKKVRNALLKDLERRENLNKSLKRIDFVVFSGDLSFSGKPEELKTAGIEFLDPVLKAVQVPKERLFIVPGNHDVDRSRLELVPALLKTFAKPEKVNEWLTRDSNRRTLFTPLEAYAAFCREYLVDAAPPEPAYCFVRRLDIEGKKVAVAGLNSAWMCGQYKDDAGEVDDYGRLILGEAQVQQMQDEAADADVRIAVLHHPFCWMSGVEKRDYTERVLLREFHFVLRGHEHVADVSVNSGSSGQCAILSAGACYDRREYPNGYAFTHLDFGQGQGTVYSRRYEAENDRFQTDVVRTEEHTPGFQTFSLPKELGRVSMPKPSAGSKASYGDPWAIQDPLTMTKLARVYESLYAQNKFRYLRSTMIVRANCLAEPDSPGFGQADEIRFVKEFQPLGEPLSCYKVALTFAPDCTFGGSFKYETTGPGALDTLVIPIRDVADQDARQVLLFFLPPLQPDGKYQLDFSFSLTNGMGTLRDTDLDDLYFNFKRAEGPVGEARLILQYPESYGKVVMEALTSGNPGEPMSEAEAKVNCPDYFKAVGWKGRNLPPDQKFGAQVRRKKTRRA